MTQKGVGLGGVSPPKSQPRIVENLVLKWCALVASESQKEDAFFKCVDGFSTGGGHLVELVGRFFTMDALLKCTDAFSTHGRLF